MSTRARLLIRIATVLAGVLVTSVVLGACPQGEGERCQRDEDCGDGLKCNLGTQLCQAGVVGVRDAAIDVGIDAELDAGPDAPPVDGPPDGP